MLDSLLLLLGGGVSQFYSLHILGTKYSKQIEKTMPDNGEVIEQDFNIFLNSLIKRDNPLIGMLALFSPRERT